MACGGAVRSCGGDNVWRRLRRAAGVNDNRNKRWLGRLTASATSAGDGRAVFLPSGHRLGCAYFLPAIRHGAGGGVGKLPAAFAASWSGKTFWNLYLYSSSRQVATLEGVDGAGRSPCSRRDSLTVGSLLSLWRRGRALATRGTGMGVGWVRQRLLFCWRSRGHGGDRRPQQGLRWRTWRAICDDEQTGDTFIRVLFSAAWARAFSPVGAAFSGWRQMGVCGVTG